MEITVSLFIISVGMLGVLSLIAQNIKVDDVDRNTIIASQLAQEGLEVVRNERDYNWLADNEWTDNWIHDQSYTVDYRGNFDPEVDSITDSGARLYINDEGFYDHDDDGEATSFSRIITVSEPTAASTSVSCLVQWQDRGDDYQYVADTVLYDWRPRD